MIKMTLIFNSKVEPAGWSETWYLAADQPAEGFIGLDGIVSLRSQLLSVNAQIVAVRASTIPRPGLPKRSLLRRLPYNKLQTRPEEYNEVGDSLLVTAQGIGGKPVQRHYRAIPDSWAEAGNTGLSTGEIRKLVGKYYSAIKDLQWGDRLITPVQWQPLPTITRDHLLRTVTLGVAAGHGVSAGEVILIRGVRGLTPPLSGQYRVQDSKATELVLRLKSVPDGLWYGNAQWSRVSDAVVLPASITDVRISHRDTGRPFGLRRGRRR